MLIYNVDTLDGLSNGQLGFVQQIVKARDGQLDKIIIKSTTSMLVGKIRKNSK